jgi:hypothetical protein
MGEVITMPEKDTEIDLKVFRDSRNKFRTESLFVELSRAPNYESYFTLKDFDLKGRISMRRKYLEIADPTEYKVGMQLLGDFKHWQVLCTRSWFIPHVQQWRMELQAQLESEAIEVLKEVAGDKKAGGRVQAAKLLVERPWEQKTNLRGRPSKEEVIGYKKQVAEEADEVADDSIRLFGEKKSG